MTAAAISDRTDPAASGALAIATRGLTKRFGRHDALVDLDLEVRRGEVFGFIGPNGAGKTTTIRLLLDLIRPTRGDARVLGLDVRRDGSAVRRRIGYLPGELALRPLAKRLSLDLQRPIRALSRGNKQKIGLVQAFMHEPDLLILDEPTGGLDPRIQHEFSQMLIEARGRGQTVFLSSDVLSDVERQADRVGLVRDGRLVLIDDVGALKARVTRRLELQLAEPPPPGTRGIALDHVVLLLGTAIVLTICAVLALERRDLGT